MTSRYTVIWQIEARNDLAEIWLNAPDRSAVSEAANLIDIRLARSPHDDGIPLSEGLLALIEPPLQVALEVREPDRLVEVAAVKRI